MQLRTLPKVCSESVLDIKTQLVLVNLYHLVVKPWQLVLSWGRCEKYFTADSHNMIWLDRDEKIRS